MGARGPAAKPAAQRRNRVKPVVPEVEVPAAMGGVPALPGEWRPEVVRWWKAWSETPAAVTFSTTEWERLIRALPLADAYWRAQDGNWRENDEGVAVLVFDPREVREAHKALLDAEKGLPATDYERRRSGIQVKAAPAADAQAASSGGGRRLRVV